MLTLPVPDAQCRVSDCSRHRHHIRSDRLFVTAMDAEVVLSVDMSASTTFETFATHDDDLIAARRLAICSWRVFSSASCLISRRRSR